MPDTTPDAPLTTATGSYIIKFKKGVSDEQAEKFYSEITGQGTLFHGLVQLVQSCESVPLALIGGEVQEKQHSNSCE